MAKHKAPTAVTITPLAEKSPIEKAIEKYWVHALMVALLIAAGVSYSHYRGTQEKAARDGSWEQLLAGVTMEGFPRLPSGDPDQLGALATSLQGSAAGPWARLVQARAFADEGKYAEAGQALTELETSYPKHPLVVETYEFEEGAAPENLVAHMRRSIESQLAWEKANTQLFENPPPPTDAPRVRIKTAKGDIVVALYEKQAPRHAANFLKLAGDGYYVGTKIHRIDPSFMIQGGDPNTIEGDPSTWGQGGPEVKIAPERNKLRHFRGVLSAAKTGVDRESSASQFFITVAPAHHLDGKHVIYGAVLEGMDVVDEISEGVLAENTTDRPADPVSIEAVEVL